MSASQERARVQAGRTCAPDASQLLRAWGELWGVPGLAERLQVRVNPRLRRSLGRCHVESGRISLHPDALDQALLAEVLCHEAAHYAAHWLFGRQARPHGPEWTALVERAGFAARTRLGAPYPSQPSSRRYLHHCPVCHMRRAARRPVPAWRCRACVEAGLEGRLRIERIE